MVVWVPHAIRMRPNWYYLFSVSLAPVFRMRCNTVCFCSSQNCIESGVFVNSYEDLLGNNEDIGVD